MLLLGGFHPSAHWQGASPCNAHWSGTTLKVPGGWHKLKVFALYIAATHCFFSWYLFVMLHTDANFLQESLLSCCERVVRLAGGRVVGDERI